MQSDNEVEIQSLLHRLITDVQEISVLWQLAVLLASLGLAWLLQKQLRQRISPEGSAGRTLNISMNSLSRLLFPLLALALVIVGREALGHWYSTHLLNIVIPLLFALALIRAAVYILRRVFSSQDWLRPWERFIGWVVWIGLVLHITGLLPEILTFFDDISFHIGKQRLSVLMIVQGILAFTISMLLALWLASSFEARIMQAAALNINQRVILSKVTRTLLILLGVLVALPMVGVDITVLSVFGGALGVGLGLGLQKIASNYISGFIILLDHSLHIGDVVTVDNRKGEVTSLTTRYVVLKIDDGTEALIPNDTFITSTVISQTYSDHRLRLILPFQIGYASPVEAAMKIILDAAKKQPNILADPEPLVILKEFADSGINLELIIWIENPEGGALRLRSSLNLEIWSEFQKHGIEIPFPQREVRLVRPAKFEN
ncbi:mechanosensitive ion channel family protein [Nitrosospira sp. NpAV]|uniref:mechanosensitive ion channel family protein n=1 Tax=Nitrosospira sp. NpAV TaxID=58133 RepID=UPI0005A2DEE1|nr:mechanosensitive ion channel domain-containing protein [Nitrosospira sp. NpAV]KIO50139.1 mechanosensitive ion channel protein MscS [Nitrosospira sp. NpAV]